jgi:hypothetical protein
LTNPKLCIDEAGFEGSLQRKRKMPETVEDVIEWFENMRAEKALAGYDDDSEWNTLIKNIGENAITGEALRGFQREEIRQLGVTLLGPATVLLRRIEDLRSSFRSSTGVVEIITSVLSLDSNINFVAMYPRLVIPLCLHVSCIQKFLYLLKFVSRI